MRGNDKVNIKQIATLMECEANDVVLCYGFDGEILLGLKIKDRSLNVEILSVFAESGTKSSSLPASGYIEEDMVFLFPYREERLLMNFIEKDDAMGPSTEGRLKVAREFTEVCIYSDLPFPLLYPVLSQSRINIDKNGEIYPDMCIDLVEFSTERTQQDCVTVLASMLCSFFENAKGKNAELKKLIAQKIERQSYSTFEEVYRDIRIFESIEKEKGLMNRLRQLSVSQDSMYKFLKVCAFVVILFLLVVVVSMVIYGDVPLLRLFRNGFSQIGTRFLSR